MSVDADRFARLETLADRQDIHDCMARMCRGTDRSDRALFLSAFQADAVIAAGPFVGGPAELYDWSSTLQETAHLATQHMILNHSCDLDGDSAHAETYYLYVGNNRDGTNVIAGGRYIDRLGRGDGIWRIATRNTVIEWSTIVPAFANPLANVPDIAANGAVSRGPDDISYRRPLVNRRACNVP